MVGARYWCEVFFPSWLVSHVDVQKDMHISFFKVLLEIKGTCVLKRNIQKVVVAILRRQSGKYLNLLLQINIQVLHNFFSR